MAEVQESACLSWIGTLRVMFDPVSTSSQLSFALWYSQNEWYILVGNTACN